MAKSTKSDPRKPQEIEVEIEHASESLTMFDYYTLDQAMEHLQNLKSRYPDKTVVFKRQGFRFEEGEEYGLYERRLETQEEVDARLKLGAEREAQREANERRQFEELSKRYGPKGP